MGICSRHVIATGETHTVREFIEAAFVHLDLDWRDYVVTDERFFRPSEIFELRGDCGKARRELAWEPKMGFADLVRLMVDEDIKMLKISAIC